MRGFLLLIAAVLAAIGIGVGAEAAFTPALYGPPGAQFTAAWPGRVTERTLTLRALSTRTSVYTARRRSDWLTVSVTRANESRCARVAFCSSVTLIEIPTPSGERALLRQVHLKLGHLRGEMVMLAVNCDKKRSTRPKACVGVITGWQVSSDDDAVSWSASAGATSRRGVLALLESVTLSTV